ncbi:Uncharacterised protein [uncultured archaeon]|nr:Uncharacterised protein [uncultured archaeon]
MSTNLIAGELDEGVYTVPPILEGILIKNSRKPLVHAIREHKHYLSEKAGIDIGWLAAKKHFIENDCINYWEYGFKYGYRAKASLNVNPSLVVNKCQDFDHFIKTQIKAAELSMLEISRRAYSLDSDTERKLFNEYQARYWSGGFREGFCGFVCPCHGHCKNSLKIILMSEPEVVKKKIFGELERFTSV